MPFYVRSGKGSNGYLFITGLKVLKVLLDYVAATPRETIALVDAGIESRQLVT